MSHLKRTFLVVAAFGVFTALWQTAVAQSRGEVNQFTVDGITVLLHPTSNSLVSAIVGFEGGVASGETQNPVLGEFAADLITSSGSETVSKDALRAFTSRTSSSITGDGDLRGIHFAITATRANFSKAWDVMASLVLRPLYDETEYRNIMQARINQVRRRWSNPDDNAEIVADSLLLLHEPVLGRVVREDDVSSATIDLMKEFMQKVRERSRMVVVVVGDVSEKELRSLVAQYSSLPEGAFKAPAIPAITPPAAPEVDIVDRQSPTTYVYGLFAGPRAATPEYWSLQIGLSYLRNVLFEEIRTKRNLSYAPGAWLGSTLGSSYGAISVSSTRPDSCAGIMLAELERMKTSEVDKPRLDGSRNVFTTYYYQRQMTNSGVANSIFSALTNTGDWRNAFALQAIRSVTAASVREAFQKYARNLQFGIAGPASAIHRDRYIFRE